MSINNSRMKPTIRQGNITGIKAIMASALLAMVLLPTVSAQSDALDLVGVGDGPPEEPDPNGYHHECHHLERTIPNCNSTFYAVDLSLWAVDYAVFCFQYPSECGLVESGLGAVEQGWLE